MKTLIDFIYTLLIGAAVAAFVGLGIWTFYAEPKFPPYPDYPQMTYDYDQDGNTVESPDYKAKMDKYNADSQKYDDTQKSYSKKTAYIALGAAIIFYVVGLWIYRKIDVVGEGLALGGAFNAVYAAIRAGTADSKPYVFASVTILLTMFVILALYRRRTTYTTEH